MQRLQKIIRPDLGVFTTLGTAHDENFLDRNQKLKEKVQLFRSSKRVVCGVDELDFQRGVRAVNPTIEIITWSTRPAEKADFEYRFTVTESKSIVSFHFNESQYSAEFNFSDTIAQENLASSVTASLIAGVPIDEVVKGIPLLQPVAMRMQRIRGIEGSSLINDAYNSDTTSLRIALEHLHRDSRDRERVVVLSDILQSGKAPQELYGKISEWLKRYHIHQFYGIGPELSKYRSLFGHNAKFFPDTTSFLRVILNENWRNKTILIKGARKFEFEDIVERLEEKEHDTIYEINLNAVQHNLNVFRRQLKPGVKTMVMVKAMAYGSGYSELARALQFHRVDYLGVAYSHEGIVLRKSGIDTPIMVMNPESDGYRNIIRHRLEPQIYNFRILHRFLEIARAEGVTKYPVHIKLETGMNRLGFQEDELDQLVEVLQRQNQISVHALFSHLAASDDPNEDEFTQSQIARFERMSTYLSHNLGIAPMRHLLNSNGITRFSKAQYDMVRLGIGLYGFSSNPEVQNQLRNIGRFKTLISQIKTIHAGDTVGYSRKYKADQQRRIATLPVGYADGIPRVYGNGKIHFRAGEYSVPTVGNICMDMCMVDVTHTDLQEGDEVVLFETTADVRHWADIRGTIMYEVLTSISERVKRIYVEE
jgi:alanine racemase